MMFYLVMDALVTLVNLLWILWAVLFVSVSFLTGFLGAALFHRWKESRKKEEKGAE